MEVWSEWFKLALRRQRKEVHHKVWGQPVVCGKFQASQSYKVIIACLKQPNNKQTNKPDNLCKVTETGFRILLVYASQSMATMTTTRYKIIVHFLFLPWTSQLETYDVRYLNTILWTNSHPQHVIHSSQVYVVLWHRSDDLLVKWDEGAQNSFFSQNEKVQPSHKIKNESLPIHQL